MRVQLLVVPDCANEAAASALLRESLDAADLSAVPVETVVVRTHAEAVARRFAGSPTFAVNGTDLFDGGEPALACRVYPGAGGHLAGVPERSALVEALRRAEA